MSGNGGGPGVSLVALPETSAVAAIAMLPGLQGFRAAGFETFLSESKAPAALPLVP